MVGIISRCRISSYIHHSTFYLFTLKLRDSWALTCQNCEFVQSNHTSKKCVNKKWRWQKVLLKFIQIFKSYLDFYFQEILTKWHCFCDVWTCKLLLYKLGIFPVSVSHVNTYIVLQMSCSIYIETFENDITLVAKYWSKNLHISCLILGK